jgi:hypothetical protein
MNYSVETVELLDASPNEFERKTTVSRTFGSTGFNDVDMPFGNTIRGILGFGTTGFSGGTPAPTLGRLELRVDNEQRGYSSTDFEVSQVIGQLMGRQPFAYDAHLHRVTTDGNAQTLVSTVGGPSSVGNGGIEKYTYLDLDPTRDDEFSVSTKGANQVMLRVDAEAADAARFVIVEKITA